MIKLFYLAKASLKKWSTWTVILSLVFLIAVVLGVKKPENGCVVGIVGNGTDIGKVICSRNDSIFSFRAYDSEEDLEKDVASGLADCGFVFEKDFDSRLIRGETDRSVNCITSVYTVKGQVASETVFRYVLEYENTYILSDAFDAVFGKSYSENDKDIIMDNLLLKTGNYLDGNSIFTIDFRNDMK